MIGFTLYVGETKKNNNKKKKKKKKKKKTQIVYGLLKPEWICMQESANTTSRITL